MQEQQTPGSGDNKKRHKVVMARVQKALSDPSTRKSFTTVEGYKTLPPQVRDALEDLDEPQLDLLSRTHQQLADAGLYEENEGGRVSFF